MPFPYYRRLSAEHKAVYQKSDAISAVEIPNLDALRTLAHEVEGALSLGKQRVVESSVNRFASAFFTALSVPGVHVYVRATRPRSAESELHGLYTFADGKDAAQIEVWMRTAAQKQVVRFRTFLRTLLHEMLHHLDVVLYKLPESFHTEGFYRRESNLMKQLAPAAPAKQRIKKEPAAAPSKPAAKVAKAAPPKKASKQLDLF